MAKKVVLDIIEAFRAKFSKAERAEVPLALRQEAPDVVFSALLEEDKAALPQEGMGGLLAEVPAMLPGMGLDSDPFAGMGAEAPTMPAMGLDQLTGTPGTPDPLAGLVDPLAGLGGPLAPEG